MSTSTDAQARQTFTIASKKLQAAIAEYSRARRELHAITGEFFGHDDAPLQRFSSADPAKGPADRAPVHTDC